MSVEYTIIVNDLPLPTYWNYFVKSSYAGVSHCWYVSPYTVLWASCWTVGAQQVFPTRLVKKPPSSLTLLPTHPSLDWPFCSSLSRLTLLFTRLSVNWPFSPLVPLCADPSPSLPLVWLPRWLLVAVVFLSSTCSLDPFASPFWIWQRNVLYCGYLTDARSV
jgi:hypothetical protein